MDRIPEETAALTVLGLDGETRSFRSLYAERPAVLVFLRHFG